MENATYGLSALRTLIAAVETVVDANKSSLEDGTSGLSALKTLIDTVNTVTDENKATLESTTYGLVALKALIDVLPASSAIAIAVREVEISTSVTLADAIETIRGEVLDTTTGFDALHTQFTDLALTEAEIQTALAAVAVTESEIQAAVPTPADIVTAIQAADFQEGSGTMTLLQVLSAIGTAVNAISTSNRCVYD